MRIIFDDELSAAFSMLDAVAAVERAYRAKVAGELIAPPRHGVQFQPAGDLVFTIGGGAGSLGFAGFRAYARMGGAADMQVVAVWNTASGELEGLVVGNRLARLRMGAIGALAARHMARPDSAIAGVIGTGEQGRCQLEGAAAVLPLRAARVFSRSAENRADYVREMSARLGIPVTAVDDPRQAVEGADIVVTATTSRKPVLEAAWLAPGTHVTMIGPKSVGESELGAEVAGRAGAIATDSMAQTAAYKPPFFLAGRPEMDRLLDLAELVAEDRSARTSRDEITLFSSGGLAGTDVAVAAAALGMGRG